MAMIFVQEATPDRDSCEFETLDEAAELLLHPGVPQPHQLQGAPPRDEADVPLQGGRGVPQTGHRGRQV